MPHGATEARWIAFGFSTNDHGRAFFSVLWRDLNRAEIAGADPFQELEGVLENAYGAESDGEQFSPYNAQRLYHIGPLHFTIILDDDLFSFCVEDRDVEAMRPFIASLLETLNRVGRTWQ